LFGLEFMFLIDGPLKRLRNNNEHHEAMD